MRRKIIPIIISLSCMLAVCGQPSAALAQKSGLALTITPPIIKNNMKPGQLWKSYLKLVNNNNTDVEAYVQLSNFDSGDGGGTVRLNPLPESETAGDPLLINNWIVMEKGPYRVPAGRSTDIPFIIDVPEDANPGDHHIAFLVGTQPPKKEGEGSAIRVSSLLGSLLLLNIDGDIDESAELVDFYADRRSYAAGEVKFSFGFRNKGNTILQPKGEIKIYDHKGREKATVAVNQKSNSGNVFPGDTRRWNFAWPVPESYLDMGPYKAKLSLSYGSRQVSQAEKEFSFWVMRWKLLISLLSGLLFIFVLIIIIVRRSIRNAVREAEERLGVIREQMAPSQTGGRVLDLKGPPARPIKKKKPAPHKGKQTLVFMLVSSSVLILILAFSFYLYMSGKESELRPIKELDQEQAFGSVEGEIPQIVSPTATSSTEADDVVPGT